MGVKMFGWGRHCSFLLNKVPSSLGWRLHLALTLTSSTRVSAGYIWHGHVRHLRLNYKMRRALLTRKNSYKNQKKINN